MFDEGCLKKDTEQAAIQLENLVNVMRTNASTTSVLEDNPLLQVFESVWHRFAKVGQSQEKKSFSALTCAWSSGHRKVLRNSIVKPSSTC